MVNTFLTHAGHFWWRHSGEYEKNTVFISEQPKTGDSFPPGHTVNLQKHVQTNRFPNIQTDLIRWTYKQTFYILGPQTYSK